MKQVLILSAILAATGRAPLAQTYVLAERLHRTKKLKKKYFYLLCQKKVVILQTQ